ncbi:hypothetical protein JCM11957_03390 [Caminibacter profundus]
MQEFKIEIEIDENGNLKAETKGIEGEICVSELEGILKGIEGEMSYKNKPEFYKKSKVSNRLKVKKER